MLGNTIQKLLHHDVACIVLQLVRRFSSFAGVYDPGPASGPRGDTGCMSVSFRARGRDTGHSVGLRWQLEGVRQQHAYGHGRMCGQGNSQRKLNDELHKQELELMLRSEASVGILECRADLP